MVDKMKKVAMVRMPYIVVASCVWRWASHREQGVMFLEGDISPKPSCQDMLVLDGPAGPWDNGNLLLVTLNAGGSEGVILEE